MEEKYFAEEPQEGYYKGLILIEDAKIKINAYINYVQKLKKDQIK